MPVTEPSALLGDDALAAELTALLGAEAVRTDETARALAAQDLMTTGETPLAIAAPASAEEMAELVKFGGQVILFRRDA